MIKQLFQKSRIFFFCSSYSGMPEIPYAQDVLYALRLSDVQQYYEFCMSNHATYIVNVGLVIAAVADELLSMRPYDEATARKLVGRAILDLTNDKDKCLFNHAVVAASEEAGAPLKRSHDWAVLVSTCTCPACRERALQAGFAEEEVLTFI